MNDPNFRAKGRLLVAFRSLNAANQDRVIGMQVARMSPEELETWASDAEAIARMQSAKRSRRSTSRSDRHPVIESWRIGN